MAKKLTVEVDADISRAKRKVQELADPDGGGAGGGADVVSSEADKLARSLKTTADNTQRLGDSAKASREQMVGMTRAFAGLALGMAATYAANRYGDDSKIGRAIGYGTSAMSLGSSGAMAGKVLGVPGMVAGAILGVGAGIYGEYSKNANADAEKAKAEKELREANLESIETWEKARARTAAFREELEKLTKSESGLADAIAKREAEDRRLAEAQRESLGDAKKLAALNRERQANAGEMDALRAALKALGSKEVAEAFRPALTAMDSLARVGGGNGGESLRIERDQLAVLRSIDQKTGKGGTWQ